MTTPPTPERPFEPQQLDEIKKANFANRMHDDYNPAIGRLLATCEALIAECDSLNDDLHRIRATADAISEDVCVDIERIKEDRDQALARVKELERSPKLEKILAQERIIQATEIRAEKAEARVKELEERLGTMDDMLVTKLAAAQSESFETTAKLIKCTTKADELAAEVAKLIDQIKAMKEGL